jgi:RNA polymerase sigma factor (sigma-70 family)
MSPITRRLHVEELERRDVPALIFGVTTTDRRTVAREEAQHLPLPDESAVQLAERLAGHDTTPSGRAVREELRARVQAGLARLSASDRELLAMRHLEQLAMAEIAAVLGITEGAVKVRHLRALQRLHSVLGGSTAEGTP